MENTTQDQETVNVTHTPDGYVPETLGQSDNDAATESEIEPDEEDLEDVNDETDEESEEEAD